MSLIIVPSVPTPEVIHPSLEAFEDDKAFIKYLEHLSKSIFSNADFISDLLKVKDEVY